MSRRFQFSLRATFVMLTVLGVWLGFAIPANQQRRAIDAIEALGASVSDDGGCVYLLGPREQIIKAIPHLKQLKRLRTIIFAMHSDREALEEVERELPQCEFVGAGA